MDATLEYEVLIDELYTNRKLASRLDSEYRMLLAAQAGSDDNDWAEYRCAEIEREMAALSKRCQEIEQQIYTIERTYVRPTGLVAGILNKSLGDTPEGMPTYDPTQEEMAQLPSYRLRAFMLMCGAIGLFVALTVSVPWLGVSLFEPVFAIFNATYESIIISAVLTAALIAVLLYHLRNRFSHTPNRGHVMHQVAIGDEQWFRSGAESWSPSQRIASCVSFGLMHVTYVVFPGALIITFMAVGGVLMREYLRVYYRTGSTKLATFASTKYHAAFNHWILICSITVLSLLIITSM